MTTNDDQWVTLPLEEFEHLTTRIKELEDTLREVRKMTEMDGRPLPIRVYDAVVRINETLDE